MRVALVHYWLVNHRGGEKVLEALCRIFPKADIFTLFYEPSAVSPAIRAMNVRASFLNPLRRFYRSLLPLMPMALESFDLRDYDLVISSESGPAKGVLTSSTTRHYCYCHTPMRYLWELYPAHLSEFRSNAIKRAIFSGAASYLRTWDFSTASRVDGFMANSRNVQRRVWKTYRRKARVVYPPVATQSFHWQPSEDYDLMVAEMVAYKRLDYAIRCFARTGRRLNVVGDGPEYKSLKAIAGPSVRFLGRVSDADLCSLYARCRSLIVPGEEDFGIATVEALASGKPVIGLARGGSVEIVQNGCGILYADATEESLAAALQRFDEVERLIEPGALQIRAGEFSEAQFERRFLDTLARFWSRGSNEPISQFVYNLGKT